MSKDRQQVVCYRLEMRLRDWTWKNEGKGENLQIAYALPWSEWPGGSQGMPIGIGGWNKVKKVGKGRSV